MQTNFNAILNFVICTHADDHEKHAFQFTII